VVLGIRQAQDSSAIVACDFRQMPLLQTAHIGHWRRPADPTLTKAARVFLADLARFAGPGGVTTGFWVALGAILDSFGLLLLVPIIGVVIGASSGKYAAAIEALFRPLGIESRVEKLVILLLCFALLVVLRAIGQWKRDIGLAKLRVGFVENRRLALVRRVVAAPWEQLAAMDHIRINRLVGSDALLLGGCVFFTLQGIVALCVLACLWMMALLMAPVLAGFTVCLTLVSAYMLLPQLAQSRALGREVMEANLKIATRGTHFLSGLKLAISQNAQRHFSQEFNETIGVLLGRQIDFLRQQSKAQIVFTVMSSVAAAGAILLGIAVFDTPPPVLIVFVVLLARMTGPAAQLQQGLQQFANFLPSYEKMKALEMELRDGQQPAAASAVPPGAVQFSGVTYCYPNGHAGVTKIDLVIEPGGFLGITGASGAGKSTFADLLVGLTAPQEGVITVGGCPLTEALRQEWKSLTGYAPQETFLFHGTVRRNIGWIVPDADDDHLWDALRIAGADGIVWRLGGLDAMVGEGGISLSGGERQRLAIARTLLRRAPLMVLDEATSALDVATERELLDRLLALPWRPAIVLIAHRAESLSRCDRVVVFADARIIEDRHRARPPAA
jgi:ATP-binding cassette, subfamily C, bacterial